MSFFCSPFVDVVRHECWFGYENMLADLCVGLGWEVFLLLGVEAKSTLTTRLRSA